MVCGQGGGAKGKGENYIEWDVWGKEGVRWVWVHGWNNERVRWIKNLGLGVWIRECER